MPSAPSAPDRLAGLRADAERLAAVRTAALACRSEHAALDRLTALAAELLDAPHAFLSLVDADGEHVHAVHGGLLPPRLEGALVICRHLLDRTDPLLVHDLHDSPHIGRAEDLLALGLRSYAGAPVLAGSHVLGGLCAGDVVVRSWTPREARLLQQLAAVAAGELRTLVLLQELAEGRDDARRRAAEQAALHRIATAVARRAGTGAVLEQTVQELVHLVSARAALVLRFTEDGGTEVLGSAGRLGGSGVGDDWHARLLEATRADRGAVLHLLEDTPCAAVPVVVGGRVWGALLVVLGDDGSAGQVEQLEQLASLVAVMLAEDDAQDRLEREATTDPLTGVANRRVLERQLGSELRVAAAVDGALIVVLLDVDRFKDVNDVHGHAAGDAVLRALADRLGGVLRGRDLLARLGGDEWALLLPDPGPAPLALLERLHGAVVAEPLAGLAVTVSVGGALVTGGTTPQEALAEADAALYEAKRGGRDRVALRTVDGGRVR